MKIMMLGEAVTFCRGNDEIKEFWLEKIDTNNYRLLFFYYPGLSSDYKNFTDSLKDTYSYIDSIEFIEMSCKPKSMDLKNAELVYCEQ